MACESFQCLKALINLWSYQSGLNQDLFMIIIHTAFIDTLLMQFSIYLSFCLAHYFMFERNGTLMHEIYERVIILLESSNH